MKIFVSILVALIVTIGVGSAIYTGHTFVAGFATAIVAVIVIYWYTWNNFHPFN